MENAEYTLTLDVSGTNDSQSVNLVQGETGKTIEVTLINGSDLYTIEPGCYAVFTGVKPDGSILWNRCAVYQNVIFYQVTAQTTAVLGSYGAQIRLYGAGGKLLCSPAFCVYVEEAVVQDADVTVLSADEITAMTELLSEIREVIDTGSETAQQAREAAERADAVAESLEDLEQAMLDAKQAAIAANATAAEADAAADRANAASQLAEDAHALAENAQHDVDTLKEVIKGFHDHIVEEAEGEFITVSDASDLELAGLKIFGKTVQNGTPTPDAPAALESIGDSGSVTVTACGKNLISDNWVQGMLSTTDGKTISANDYWVTNSDYIPVSSNLAYSFSADSPNRSQMFFYDVNKEFLSSRAPLADSSTSVVTISDNVKYVRFAYNYSGATETITPEQMGVTHYLQLELGSTATAYEPYTATTATVSTPNGLPGIPVESGGNYTDAEGQQWICDEVDFARGVYVQRVVRESWTSGGTHEGTFISFSSEFATLTNALLCNIAVRKNGSFKVGTVWRAGANDRRYIVGITGNDGNVVYATVADFWAVVSSVEVIAPLAEENPIPLTDIDPDALTAYATMHTNYPNTTVFNDAGAHMGLSYVADTRRYIDKKFDQLAKALVSST